MQLRRIELPPAKAIRPLASLCFAFVALAAAAAAQGQSQPFSLSIAGPNGVIAAGGACDVSVTLTNTSEKLIRMPVTNGEGGWGPRRDLTVTVVSLPSGRALKPIPIDPRRAIYTQSFSRRSETLQPGQKISGVTHLCEIFDLSVPRTYQVQMRRDVPKEIGAGVVTSNTIEITTEPGGKPPTR